MNIKGGYILIARAIDDSEVAKFPPHTREIWLYLLRKSEYKDVVISGTKIKRGQLYTTYKDIIEDLSWNIGFRKESYTTEQCNSAMKTLRATLMITTARTTRGVVITICKYEHYQEPKNYENLSENLSENRSYTNRSENREENLNENHSDNRSEILPSARLEDNSTHTENLSENPSENRSENPPIPKELKKEELKNNTLQSKDCPIYNKDFKKEEKQKAKIRGRAKKETPVVDQEAELNKKAREIFESRYLRVCRSAYYWQGKDAGNMTRLLNALKHQREQKGLSNENNLEVIAALTFFLNTAVKDEWIVKNFSISVLFSKFNEIVARAQSEEKDRKKQIEETSYGSK